MQTRARLSSDDHVASRTVMITTEPCPRPHPRPRVAPAQCLLTTTLPTPCRTTVPMSVRHRPRIRGRNHEPRPAADALTATPVVDQKDDLAGLPALPIEPFGAGMASWAAAKVSSRPSSWSGGEDREHGR